MKKALWVFAVVLFGCADNPPTIDGHTYKTVQIGDQEWFAENLKTTVYANGDVIPANLSDDEWGSIEIGALAVYEGEILYNWYAVNDVRCLCPKGWHVPTDREWTIMTDFLGGNEVAGEKMRTTYGWKDGGNGTNSSGFSGLPGGSRDALGAFDYAGLKGGWWSSSMSDFAAWYRYLGNGSPNVYRNFFSRRHGHSVRCLKDAE